MPNLHSTKILGDLRVTGLTKLNEVDAFTLNGQLTSTVVTGTAPFVVASTTLVNNLNAEFLNGRPVGDFYLASNPNGYVSSSGVTSITAGAGLSGGTITSAGTITHGNTAPSVSSLNVLSGGNVVSDIDVDAYGHVTSMATRTMTLSDLGYIGHTDADKYTSWTLQALNSAGTSLGSSAITSGDIAQFQAGTNVTLAWADDKITISSANTTYSAGSGLSLSGTQFNHSNAVTAGTVSGSSGAVNFGGTVTIPSITYDAQGHITSKGTTTITLPTPNYTVDTDSYINSASFATGTGVLSLNRTGDVTGTVTVDLDGRYLLSSSFVNNYITGYTWNNGTTAGPTATITRNGLSNLSVSAFPSASASVSGVVTTGTQTFAGQKTFTDKAIFNGDIQVTGTVITNNVETLSTANGVVFEGTVADAYELELKAGALTADRTITLPDETGTLATQSYVTSRGYITGYTETDTLDSVADRGSTTNQSITTGGLTSNGNIYLDGTPTTTNQARTISFTGFDKEGTTDSTDNAYIRHTTNVGGVTGSVLEISSMNDSTDGIAFTTHPSSNLKHNGNTIWTDGNLTNLNQLTNGPGYIISSSSITGNAATATWADQVDINSSTSTSLYNILWHSGDTIYNATGDKLRVQPSTGNVATAGSVTVGSGSPNGTGSGTMKYNATTESIEFIFN